MQLSHSQKFSPFHLSFIGGVVFTLIFYFINLRLFFLPMVLFLALCATAPFIQRLNFFLPIITHGDRTKKQVALTFDDGPDPATTPQLLNLLSTTGTKVTFFVIGQKALDYPELIREILAHGHQIGNHSLKHDNFLMLRRTKVLRSEIDQCQKVLRSFGIRPLVFRPPVGITNPKLAKVLAGLELVCLGFSCRAVDFGNRRIIGLKESILKKVRGGDIIMLHDRHPAADIGVETWLAEVEGVLAGVKSRGFDLVPLSDLIEQPVMEKLK